MMNWENMFVCRWFGSVKWCFGCAWLGCKADPVYCHCDGKYTSASISVYVLKDWHHCRESGASLSTSSYIAFHLQPNSKDTFVGWSLTSFRYKEAKYLLTLPFSCHYKPQHTHCSTHQATSSITPWQPHHTLGDGWDSNNSLSRKRDVQQEDGKYCWLNWKWTSAWCKKSIVRSQIRSRNWDIKQYFLVEIRCSVQ